MLNKLTITEARELLDKAEISAVSLTAACLEAIREKNSELNACLEINEADALAAAAVADKRLNQGERTSLLGIPFLLKDNILAKNFKATAASKMLKDYQAPYNATVVERLLAAGAVLLGKTNLDEFAHGSSTESSFFGPTKNPWDINRTPGGSSGGSAVAVAADMCLFALGTETGGSIRHPASFCGVVGLKPSYGRCSRFGLISMTSSTDVPGPITKTVKDAALVLEIMAGADQRDLSSLNENVSNISQILNIKSNNIKVGVVKEFFSDAVDKGVKEKMREAIKVFEQSGAKIEELSLPHALSGVAVYCLLTPSEISSNLARFDGWRYGHKAESVGSWQEIMARSRGEAFGDEVKRRIMLGTFALSAGYHDQYYMKAQSVRALIVEDFAKAFANVDIIISPTTPNTAFKLGEFANDPMKAYLEDIFLTPASLAGLPAVSVPTGLSENLPVGIQLMANKLEEGKLLQVALILENHFGRLTYDQV